MERPPSRNPVPKWTPEYFKAGMEPKSRLATNDSASVKTTTVPSMPISSRRGRPDGAKAIRSRKAP
jgi:hypothetical protein